MNCKSELLFKLSGVLNQCYQALSALTVKGAEAEAYVGIRQNLAAVNNEIVKIGEQIKACEAGTQQCNGVDKTSTVEAQDSQEAA